MSLNRRIIYSTQEPLGIPIHLNVRSSQKAKFYGSITKAYNDNEYVKFGAYNFEIVKGCTYLGTIITNKNELRPEIAENNHKCQQSMLCTSSSTAESLSTQSRKKQSSTRH